MTNQRMAQMMKWLCLSFAVAAILLFPNFASANTITANWSFTAGANSGSGTLAATSITASTYNITAFNGTINGTSITLIANTCGIGVVCNYLGTGTYDNILYDPTVNGSYLDNAGILATDAAGDFINLFAGPSVGSPDIYGPCTNLGACNSVNMTPGPGNQGFAVSTPELSSLPLLALGLAGLGFAVNRKTLIRR